MVCFLLFRSCSRRWRLCFTRPVHPSHRRDSAGCTTGFGQWDGRSLTGKQLNLKQLMYQAERCRKMQKVQYKTRNLRSFKPSRNSCKDTTTLKILKGFSVQYYFWVLMLLANCCDDPKRSIDFGNWEVSGRQWPMAMSFGAARHGICCFLRFSVFGGCKLWVELLARPEQRAVGLRWTKWLWSDWNGLPQWVWPLPTKYSFNSFDSLTHFLLLHLSWNIFGPGLHMYLVDMWLHMVARGCTWLHVPEECRHLDTVEQRRFSTNEFRYPSSPALVITASRDGKRCASTWAFNAVRWPANLR